MCWQRFLPCCQACQMPGSSAGQLHQCHSECSTLTEAGHCSLVLYFLPCLAMKGRSDLHEHSGAILHCVLLLLHLLQWCTLY